MFAKILIPLDGSQVAERVLPFARMLADALKLPIELVEVVDIAAMSAHIAADKARYFDKMITEGERISREYLDKTAANLGGVKVVGTVLRGHAADVITERASAEPGTLIAMATHGRSGVNRWLLGSVAEKVLRGTKSPLLLVRAGFDNAGADTVSLKTVVVPLDGSETAESALPTVTEVAKALNLEVVLCRAYELAASAYYGSEAYLPNYEEMTKQVKAEAEDYLREKAEALKAAGLPKVSLVALEGSGAEQIIHYARQHHDALVAMSTHGRSGVGRWVLGSVTEKVVRHSDDPVLVIHAGQ
jgi:nucleotide-binding universal stress UspA family protein